LNLNIYLNLGVVMDIKIINIFLAIFNILANKKA
jgi:hypothetical protein